jgi:hypothetical protein
MTRTRSAGVYYLSKAAVVITSKVTPTPMQMMTLREGTKDGNDKTCTGMRTLISVMDTYTSGSTPPSTETNFQNRCASNALLRQEES